MKSFTFSKDKKILIKQLKNTVVNKIYWDFISIIFDYGNYYIKLECKIKPIESNYPSREIIIAAVEKIEKEYIAGEQSILICENQKITEVFIVRAFVYFRNCREYTKIKRKLKDAGKKIKVKLKVKIKKFFTGKKNSHIRLLSNKDSECEEVVCHPQSSRAGQNNSGNAILMDIGLLIGLSSKYLRAYLPNNSFGFPIRYKQNLFEPDEIKKDALLYEFINME